jgi:predicted RNA-binding protein with PUA-like domain
MLSCYRNAYKPEEDVGMAGTKSYWLLKTEPDVFSIHDLARQKNQTTYWDGVRNYQARNFMRDEMKVGDGVLVYHSNADPPGVAGTAKIVRTAYPDFTSWDKQDEHYDPKSTLDNPRWFMVDIQLDEVFAEPISLATLREVPALREMELLRKGSRLSVQPVRKKEFDAILKLAKKNR